MSDQPTGVFVRLPLSEEQKASVYDLTSKGGATDAILAIGTPVTGGGLTRTGTIAWFEKDREPSLASYCPGLFKAGDSVPVTSLPIAQAHIAALESEVVRLRGVIVEAVDALTRVTEERSTQYQAKNGRWVSIQADDGERCDIIHSDITTDCEAAILSAHKALKGGAA
ncbi:hypothetical protein [Acetobacter okinawensis]|uniref:hypothetical protein n=1 Tax=Acetobacter okinawensis TaxID=1076594 RepID=UPI0039E76CE1